MKTRYSTDSPTPHRGKAIKPVVGKYAGLLPPLATEEFDALRTSIKAEGVRELIVVDETGVILDGHHRYKVDRKAPHRVVSNLTETEKIAYVYRANLTRRNLSPDQKPALREQMRLVALALKDEKKGISQAQIGRLLGVARSTVEGWLMPIDGSVNRHKKPADSRVKVSKEGKVAIAQRVADGESQVQIAADYGIDQSQVSRIAKKYQSAPAVSEMDSTEAMRVAQPKQIWKLGEHRLVCGDAYNQENVRSLLGDDVPDALVTDPPYGINYEPAWEKWDGTQTDFESVIGDDRDFDPAPFIDYPTVVLFGANYYSPRLPVGNWICWDKRVKEDLDNMVGSPFELAWFKSRHTTRKAIMVRVQHGGVVNADSQNGNNEKRFVSTQKPIKVMQAILQATTLEGEIVYDPFSGSGSTLLACNSLKRRCLAMEIDPAKVDIILHRWKGQKGIEPCLA